MLRSGRIRLTGNLSPAMNRISKIVSLLALSLIIVPSFLYCLGTIGLDGVKWSAIVGTLGWFVVTPLWMSRDLQIDSAEVEI